MTQFTDPHEIETAEMRLYKAREPIFPKRVSGWFRNLKWWIMGLTLLVYYVTPWLRWDRGPEMPDQAVLVDLANRRFYFFFIEIWPQEFYYIAGLLIMAGIGLFLFTSVLGRVWCGYACPQTVWTDLFILVERWIEGDRNARIRLHKQAWTGGKIAKRVFKWLVWLLIAVGTGGAWVFYFADAPTLFVDLFTGQAAFVAYATVGVLTATTFVFGGFMREQICIYACPWPRIQSAMLDENSLLVTYKDWRGEPRGKHTKKAEATGAPQGDCVDCNQCVAVCPMGIDIRNGSQLECITCALCIDACDTVMAKLGRERGLIDYVTLKDAETEKAGGTPRSFWQIILRPRVILYTALWALIGVAMLVMLMTRDRLDVTVQKDRNPVFVTLSDGSIRNGYTVKILNMNPEPREFRLSLAGNDALTLRLGSEGAGAGATETKIPVNTDEVRAIRVFVMAPRGATAGTTGFDFVVEDLKTGDTSRYEANFNGPKE